MPPKFRSVYNGHCMVNRPIVLKHQTATVGPVAILQNKTPQIAILKPVVIDKPVDAKAMRAKLAAELFKSL